MPTKLKLPAVMRGDTWNIRVVFSDMLTTFDGACTLAAPNKITSASAAFTTASAGRKIRLDGAGEGGAEYEGKIMARDSATQVTVSPNISKAVSAKDLAYGVPVDISGHRVRFTLKNKLTDPDPGVLQTDLTCPADANSVAGIGFIVATSTQTLAVPAKEYFYDIQRSIAGSPPTVMTAVYGPMEVLEHATVTAP
ncbi:hypothetical protein BH20PSE1_BH20PSE1_01040 [soil metagenome]